MPDRDAERLDRKIDRIADGLPENASGFLHWLKSPSSRWVRIPIALLIRGVDGITGPGRLTKALGIDGRFNGLASGKQAGLWLEKRAAAEAPRIKRSARIGVAYASPVWSKKEYRFTLK